MQKMKSRAKAHFPSVLLTLISIIQALALELMWSKIVESDFLWTWGFPALIGWGMIAVSFLGILQIWIMYSTMVMGFVWQPLLRDSIIPFIIGIQEFLLITLVSEQFSTLWLYVLGSLFVIANWVSHNSMRRARLDPENAAFFGKVEPATLKDFGPAIGIVSSLVLFGIIIDLTGNQSWIPLGAIAFVNIALLMQIAASQRLWRNIIGSEDDG